MKTKIVPIGNSKGVRIPKQLLEEAKLVNNVDISVAKGKVVIRPASEPPKKADEGVLVSRSGLAKEWDTPEEDKAWASLQ